MGVANSPAFYHEVIDGSRAARGWSLTVLTGHQGYHLGNDRGPLNYGCKRKKAG